MIALDPKTTALVLIDLQNGILGRPLAPISADGTARARQGAGGKVSRRRGAGRAGERQAAACTGRNARSTSPLRCPKPCPTGFADLAPGLAEPGDLLITKSTWGAFFRTDLDAELRKRGVRTIVLGGVATHIGVDTTARQAWELGYELVIARDRDHQHGRRAPRGDDALYLPPDRTGDGQRRPRLLAGMSVRPLTLNARPAALHWAALIGGDARLRRVCSGSPACPRLCCSARSAGAILVASFEGRVHIPPRSFILAQGVIGCLIAKAIGAASMGTMLKQWPIFLIGIGAVMAFAAGLGVLLARWKVLPGTTAIWGSSPGAATAMVLMAEAFGARHPAGRGHAISARRLRRADRVDRRAGMGRARRRGAAPARLVSSPRARAFPRDAGDRRRRRHRSG